MPTDERPKRGHGVTDDAVFDDAPMVENRNAVITGDFAYVGSFEYTGTEGIHICAFHRDSGTLEYIKTVARDINPGNVYVFGDTLFATDERMFGNVVTFRINAETGDLTQLDCTDTLAVNPSYVTIDSTEKYAVITHFAVGPMVRKIERDAEGKINGKFISNDSATCLYRLTEDGRLGELLDVGLHDPGSAPMTMVHKAYECPWEPGLFAENDLGANKVYFFRIEDEKLRYLKVVDVGGQCEFGGEGPRHGAFHPQKPYLYLNFEHRPTVAKLDISDLEHAKVVEELPLFQGDERLEEGDNQAELMFHPNGKVLYSFLRGKGICYVISVDEQDGSMRLLQRFLLPGKDPRGSFFSPDCKHILMEGHYANEVYTLDVAESGVLTYAGKSCHMPRPACIGFKLAAK